jgi:hypothetical protein
VRIATSKTPFIFVFFEKLLVQYSDYLLSLSVNTSGLGKLSKSAKLSSLIQVISNCKTIYGKRLKKISSHCDKKEP